MPKLIKKCFLFHYNPSINSDKVFNLFLIDNENGTFSAVSEYGRSGTNLNVKPLIENCSLALAQSRYETKLNEKVYHRITPYTHTLNGSGSPTFKKLSGGGVTTSKSDNSAKVFEFKAENSPVEVQVAENESGGQKVNEEKPEQLKKIGVLNLKQLDALEI